MKYSKIIVSILFVINFSACNSCNETDKKNNGRQYYKRISEENKVLKENAIKGEKEHINPFIERNNREEEYICSALNEDILGAIKEVEFIINEEKDKIKTTLKNIEPKNRIFGISDTEGKYFNIYAWLRVSGLVDEFNTDEYLYYDLSGCKYYEFGGDKKKRIKIPKLKINENFNGQCIHLGDIVDRGCNSINCLLTLLWIKQQLKNKNRGEQLILIVGNHEIADYGMWQYNRCEKIDIISIVKDAIKKDLIQFFRSVKIGGTDFLLTHREINQDTYNESLQRLAYRIEIQDLFKEIEKINSKFKEDLLNFYGPCELSWDVNNWAMLIPKIDRKKIFINQICGHIHHSLSNKEQAQYLKEDKGYFFSDGEKYIIYWDNYSTTNTNKEGGSLGFSKANIHVIDKSKKIEDYAISFCDQQDYNFQVFKNGRLQKFIKKK